MRAVTTKLKEPRQCIKCGRWFFDSSFYPEGHYGCRHHACDDIDFIIGKAQPKSWWERLKEKLGVMQ